MSEYLDEALWRENYRDLIAGVRMIREAAEQSFGPLASLPNPASPPSSIQDCRLIAEAIYTFAAKTQCRVAKLEKLLKAHGLVEAA
jgi:hypothetical protein